MHRTEDQGISADKDIRLNGDIGVARVRLIDQAGANRGVVDIRDARRIASEAEMDLVEISPQAEPPVCKVMDYGKFRFERKKKAQQAKRKQKQIQVKEVKFRPGTEEQDYQVKLRNLVRFLSDGDKAKVTVRFRGRELHHRERGERQLERVEQDLKDYGEVEQYPKMEGRQMIMVLAPRRQH